MSKSMEVDMDVDMNVNVEVDVDVGMDVVMVMFIYMVWRPKVGHLTSGTENRNQDRSQCKPLRRRNRPIDGFRGMHLSVSPPPQEISLSPDICLQGEGEG